LLLARAPPIGEGVKAALILAKTGPVTRGADPPIGVLSLCGGTRHRCIDRRAWIG